jgi:hypothetical protein
LDFGIELTQSVPQLAVVPVSKKQSQAAKASDESRQQQRSELKSSARERHLKGSRCTEGDGPE